MFGINYNAQVSIDTIDLKYLEDQLYLSFHYNVLNKKNDGIAQRGFSGGIASGFIKDIPINERRNFGIGIGIGYAFNVYVHNLKVEQVNKNTNFSIATDYNTNRFQFQSVEFPFELRWRSSTASKYRFWRIYPGFKVSHLFSAKTKHKDVTGAVRTNNIPEIIPWQYGFTISIGYGTWNIHLYHGFTHFFDNAILGNDALQLKEMTIAIKFYVI
jgi:hypothetical protein